MAPVQGVTHLWVCWSLNLAAAAATDWTASECKGPRAVPERGWRVHDREV